MDARALTLEISVLSHRSKALSGDFNGDTATRELTLETSALSLMSLLLSLRTRVLTLIAQRSHGLRNPLLEEVYNRKRLHSSIGYVPPLEFEAAVSNMKPADWPVLNL